MKRLSIKANITLWYTGLLVVFLALVMLFVLYLSDNLMLSRVKSALVDIVVYNAEEIGAINDRPDLSDLERYDNGVNILVHTLNGDLIFGRYPTGFPEKTALSSGVVQTISTNDKQWYVYDYLVTSPQHEGVMVRGISSMDIVTETINIATFQPFSFFRSY